MLFDEKNNKNSALSKVRINVWMKPILLKVVSLRWYRNFFIEKYASLMACSSKT